MLVDDKSGGVLTPFSPTTYIYKGTSGELKKILL